MENNQNKSVNVYDSDSDSEKGTSEPAKDNNKTVNHCQIFYNQLVAFGFKVPELPADVTASTTVPDLIKQWGATGSFDANAIGRCGEPLLIWLLVHYHCREELIAVVKTLLSQPRANVNVTHKMGNYNALATLFVSYVNDYAERQEAREMVHRMVNVFMKHGINLNHVDDYGLNALWYACLIDGPQADEIIGLYRRFMSAGVDVNLKAEKYGRYALVEILHDKLGSAYGASWTGRHYLDVVRLFVDHGFSVNHADRFGSDALMILAGDLLQRPGATHKLDIVKLFIENGIDLKRRNADGNNVLDILCSMRQYPADNDFVDVLKLLLGHGASDAGGANAVMTFLKSAPSVTIQTKQVITLLAEHGVNVHYEDAEGHNALTVIAKRDDLPIKQVFMLARHLIENHRVKVRTSKGDALMDLLCVYNANKLSSPRNHHDYLHLALLVELFIVNDVVVSEQDKKERMTRALMYSLRHYQRDDFAKVVQLLCQNGADTSVVYEFEATPVLSPRAPVMTMQLNFEECMAILNWRRGKQRTAADAVRPERSPSVAFKRSPPSDAKEVADNKKSTSPAPKPSVGPAANQNVFPKRDASDINKKAVPPTLPLNIKNSVPLKRDATDESKKVINAPKVVKPDLKAKV